MCVLSSGSISLESFFFSIRKKFMVFKGGIQIEKQGIHNVMEQSFTWLSS